MPYLKINRDIRKPLFEQSCDFIVGDAIVVSVKGPDIVPLTYADIKGFDQLL